MQCPVCSRPAENRTPTTLPAIVLACSACGDYRIAADAYHGLAQMDAARRALALDHAKRSSRHGLPMIDIGSLRTQPAPS